MRQNMLLIPDNVGFVDAAMAEPLACVLRGIHEMGINPGDTVVVIGCGPIGLKFIRILSGRGMRVIAIGKRKSQMRAAERLGAIATFDAAEIENPVSHGAPDQRGRPRSRCCDRSGGHCRHLAMGASNGAQRRDRKSFWRLSARHRSENRSHGAALFRNHHQVHFSSYASVYARSARQPLRAARFAPAISSLAKRRCPSYPRFSST